MSLDKLIDADYDYDDNSDIILYKQLANKGAYTGE